jgi:hypothetical protein
VLSGSQIVPPRRAGRRPRRWAGGCAVSLAVAQAALSVLPSVTAALPFAHASSPAVATNSSAAAAMGHAAAAAAAPLHAASSFVRRVGIHARGERTREKERCARRGAAWARYARAQGPARACGAHYAPPLRAAHAPVAAAPGVRRGPCARARVVSTLTPSYTWRLTTTAPTKGLARAKARGSRATMTTMMFV